MNILFVNSTRKWGGVKTWSIDMSSALKRKGHNAWIVGRPGPFVDKAAALGIPATAHPFGFDMNPASVVFFLKFMRENKIDVLICNISKDLRSAGVAARLLGIPMVHRLGAPGDVLNRPKTRITQKLLKPRLLACSRFVQERLTQSVPVYADYEFTAIFPGTRPAEVPPSANHTPRTIIATSQLNKDKAHPHLLQALAGLKKRGYDFRCIILGTGNDEAKLKALCTSLDLDNEVEWTGFVTDVQAQLARADIFVLPTFCEPLGISLEEAMANGLVPIARKAGGPKEIWPPNLRHLLVGPKGEGELFEKPLASLLDLSDDELLAMKREVHAHAADTFSLDGQADKFVAWLERFVS